MNYAPFGGLFCGFNTKKSCSLQTEEEYICVGFLSLMKILFILCSMQKSSVDIYSQEVLRKSLPLNGEVLLVYFFVTRFYFVKQAFLRAIKFSRLKYSYFCSIK